MTVREHIAMQEKRAAEAAERAAEEARELKEYRSQLTFKASSVSRKSSPCLCHLTLILIGSLGLSKLEIVLLCRRVPCHRTYLDHREPMCFQSQR